MIRIRKNIHPPRVQFVQPGHPHLRRIKWQIGTQNVIADYNANPLPFTNGTYTFGFDYGEAEFRRALLRCQGPKCCFCEKPVHNGQIEHFRPVKGWKQSIGRPLNRPGYFWLAYKWENMLISCGECNHPGQKGNLFPLTGTRATNPTMNYSLERNLIIDPVNEDPLRFISFNLDVPVPVRRSRKGTLNINIFKLKDRGDIKTIRGDRLELYRTQKIITSLSTADGVLRSEITQARRFLRLATNRKQPFAGMITENIRKGLI